MITKNYVFDIKITDFETLNIPKEDVVFFDIETTGFSARSTSLYLVGVMYYDSEKWNMIQWFADSSESEPLVLSAFFEFIKAYKIVIHFNGEGFDMPYLIHKCIKYNLIYNFEKLISFDILKKVKGLQKLLKLENYKQKTIETFLGIERDDHYSGGELITVYNQYLTTKSEDSLNLLLLHNKEDILGMLQIIPILSYSSILENNFLVSGFEVNIANDFEGFESKEAIFTLTLSHSLQKRVSCGNNIFYITAYGNTLKLRVKIYTGELKFFYSNYKDYYYLPEEDTSIHKSIAFYVDKNYRTKAKAANCYSKKTGMFIPEYDEIVSPYFKIDYYEKTLYFELEESFVKDPALQQAYIIHIIDKFLR